MKRKGEKGKREEEKLIKVENTKIQKYENTKIKGKKPFLFSKKN